MEGSPQASRLTRIPPVCWLLTEVLKCGWHYGQACYWPLRVDVMLAPLPLPRVVLWAHCQPAHDPVRAETLRQWEPEFCEESCLKGHFTGGTLSTITKGSPPMKLTPGTCSQLHRQSRHRTLVIQRANPRAVDMARLVKCLLCKHGDPSRTQESI